VQRNAMYRDAEKLSLEEYKRECEFEKQRTAAPSEAVATGALEGK